MNQKLGKWLSILLTVSLLLFAFACSGSKGEGGNKNAQAPSNNANSFSISYELDGGIEESNPTSYTEEDALLLHTPIKEGYTFSGWTYEGRSEPQLIVRIPKGSSGDKHFVAHYEPFSFDPLKIAVFADVQLRNTGSKDGNQDSTSNAYLALRNHLQYAKSIEADVLFMNGDIVNNAVMGYYETFMTAFRSVYGTDESNYPEFVMNMGNHEWWDANENESPVAVAMFKQYARIETEALVQQSSIPYYLDKEATLPSYYKVINGIPFLVISGDNSSGSIGPKLRTEIEGWLEEINELPSVKRGGPIFVAYHCAIMDVTFEGEGAANASIDMDELLKGYPNAILFTGDTHFNAVNERTINQIDYTSINIGSSSYSRSISCSATGFSYDNVKEGNNKSSAGTMLGDLNFMFEYTPTMMVITMDDPDITAIDRYFTADNSDDAVQLGKTWQIPLIKSTDDFTYTAQRIKNPVWAEQLYGKKGLSWADGEKVTYNRNGNKMVIQFKDVEDFNCAEHYRIQIKDASQEGNFRNYDYMGHYYTYDSEPHTYTVIADKLPEAIVNAENLTVTVTAYDFFDNPSMNVLTATAPDTSLAFPDAVDMGLTYAYTNLSKRLNYSVTAPDSPSSVEYYFHGTKVYGAGMILGRLIDQNSDTDLKDMLSVTDWSNAVLRCKVKNANDYDMRIGLTLVTHSNGADQWLADGDTKYQVTIPKNSDWVTVEFRLSDTFGIKSDIIKNLAFKAFPSEKATDPENGYTFHFFMDDIDIVTPEA